MRIIKEYTVRLVLAAGILVGVQVPHFVDQYAQRVSAHFLEASENFRGFQDTADKYFSGNVDSLIAKHAKSPDPVFAAEAKPIQAMYLRVQMFASEMDALQTDLLHRILHIARKPIDEVLRETVSEYSATIPLNAAAVVCGIVLGLLASLLAECMFLLPKLILAVARKSRTAIRTA